jgi:hypothetical protein
VLPCRLEAVAVQRPRVDLEDQPGQPLDRLDLDPLGAAHPAGRLDGPHVAAERLGGGEHLQFLDALRRRPCLEGLQQRPGRELRASVRTPQRRVPLLAGREVEALEHRPDLLGRRDPGEAARRRRATDEPAGRFASAREILFAVLGNLVEPVLLLADLQRLRRQRQPPPPASGSRPCIADADV